MRPAFATALIALALVIVAQGCSHRAWYEGFREGQRDECYRTTTGAALRECLDGAEATSYDEYEKARRTLLDKPPEATDLPSGE